MSAPNEVLLTPVKRPVTPVMNRLLAPSRPSTDALRVLSLSPEGLCILEYTTPEHTFTSAVDFLRRLQIDGGMRHQLLNNVRTIVHLIPQGERIAIYHQGLPIMTPIYLVPPFKDENLRATLSRMLRMVPPVEDRNLRTTISRMLRPEVLPTSSIQIRPRSPTPFYYALAPPSFSFKTPDYTICSPIHLFQLFCVHPELRHQLLKQVHEAATTPTGPILVTHPSFPLPLTFHIPLTDEAFIEFLENAKRTYDQHNILLHHVRAGNYCIQHMSCPPNCDGIVG